MSHYSLIETEFRDEDVLVASIEELQPEWQVERHSTATSLFGYHDDVRPERANLVIRRRYVGSSSNDVGFVKQGNSYKAILSDYDQGFLGTDWLSKLTQLYAKNKTLKEMKMHGWHLSSQATQKDGTIKLTLEV